VKILYIKCARLVFVLPHYTVGSSLNQAHCDNNQLHAGETFVDNYHHWIAYLNPQRLIIEKTVQTRRVAALRNYQFVYFLNNYKTHEMTAARRVKKPLVRCRAWPSITSHSEPPLHTVSYRDLVTHRRSVLILSSHVWPGRKCCLQLQLCSHISSVTRAICTTTGTEVTLLSGSVLFEWKLKFPHPHPGPALFPNSCWLCCCTPPVDNQFTLMLLCIATRLPFVLFLCFQIAKPT